MIKNIIFDMDGLLVDTEIVSLKMYQQLTRRYNQELTTDQYAENFSGKPAVVNMNLLIQMFNLPITTQEGLDFVDVIEKDLIAKGVNLKPGATELLTYLKSNNYQIALATSSHKSRAVEILKQNNIYDYFDAETYGPEIKHGKPSPDIFLTSLDKLNAKNVESLVLEDSEAGITAATNAEIKVICVPDMRTPRPEYAEKAFKILPDLGQVITVLQ